MQQLVLFGANEKEELINKRLIYIDSLFEKGNIANIEVVAINKYYEFSFLGKKDGRLKHFDIYEKENEIVLRSEELGYPFERVVNGTLNFILVSN